MGMKSPVPFLLLATVLSPLTADAQSGAGGRFEACVWPNRCGPGTKAPVSPKPDPAPPTDPKLPPKDGPKPVPNLTMPTDPLSQAILQRQLAGEEGIVSAVRLKKEQTGSSEDQILYHGKADLRDALGAAPSLPASKIPRSKRDAKAAAKDKDEWKKIDSTGAAAKQVNGMADERRSLSGTQAESKEGMDRMWGDKAKRADK
jgi:hypothetical protein